tara:strand:+ start:113 stop:1000 length:888 start_codon:yes stop_codon:yes gene_type:complete
MKIFKNLFIIFVFINAYNFAHAQKIDLGSFNTTMLEIDKEKEVIKKFKSEFEFYKTLKEIKDSITQEKLDNNMLSDALVIIDSLSNIENTFPKTVKIKFEKDFLVGANLTISDLKNASFFLNSLNKQKVQNLNKSIDLISSKKIIQLSKIQRTVFQNFNVNPRILISELESMPEIDLIGLSSSIENTTSELGKNISSLSENIENASNEVDKMTEKINSVSSSISFAVGASISIAASNLDQAAEMIANTISSGVAVDLEAASQGMGFDSFADAVNAYNEQYGTNYTVDSAKEALGQ